MASFSMDLKEKVTQVIRNSVISTFNELFQVKVSSERRHDHVSKEGELSCRVDLFQDDMEATLRFTFEKELLHTLIMDMYAPETLESQSTYEDAACEIANIVCCRVKAFLNGQGYNMSMKIPYAEKPGHKDTDGNDTVHLSFSLQEEDFFVDFDMSGISEHLIRV